LPIALGHAYIFSRVFALYGNQSRNTAIWFFLLFPLNPAFWFSGIVWGQFDVLLWGFVFLSVVAHDCGRFYTSGGWSAMAFLIKPQFLLFVPLMVYLWLKWHSVKTRIIWLAAFVGVVIAYTSPWMLTSGMAWITEGYRRAYRDPAAALATKAYNAWYPISMITGATYSDDELFGVPYRTIGFLITGGLSFVAGILWLRRKQPFYCLACVHLLTCYLFLTSMNPRYLCYGLGFLGIWSLQDRFLRLPTLILSGCQVMSLAHRAVFDSRSRWYGTLPEWAPSAVPWLCFGGLVTLYGLVVYKYLKWVPPVTQRIPCC
jgi:Gpi18-like mannosyltransferase